MEKQILEQLAKRHDGLRKAELRRLVGANAKDQAREFHERLRDLLQRGAVVRQGRGRYGLPKAKDGQVGILSVNVRGFGFVACEGEEKDYFIPPSKLGNAFAGDRVRVRLIETTERGPVGAVEAVLERGHTVLTGEYSEAGPAPALRPIRRDYPEEIPLAFASGDMPDESLGEGDWIMAELVFPEDDSRRLKARYLRKLNDATTLTEDIDAIIAEFALPPPYSEEERQRAAQTVVRPIKRRDLGGLTVMTIDPVDAKDFDDAISLQATERPDVVRIGIHIADVAAYVVPGSELDMAARRRSFTAYLPGHTLPMLPKPLAADLCSLREGLPRPAHSVFLEVHAESGEVLARERCHTILTVTKRLTFGDVEEALAGSPPESWPPAVRDTIRELGKLAVAMREKRRREEGFLELATAEVRVLYEDEPPAIIGFQESRPNPAHQLVEEFMLAANVAVAEEFVAKSMPGIYRVHAEPKQSDIGEFRDWTRSALGLKPGRLESRGSVNAFLAQLQGSRPEQIVLNAFLRTLPRAVYSTQCTGHFGLGKEKYSHFTSPIRRYADLTVHQQLWQHDSGEPLLSEEECEKRAGEVTGIEAVNDEAYYAALDRVKIRYLNQLRAAGERLVFEAIISRATADGLLLFIPELGMIGFAQKEQLGDDAFAYSATSCSLLGRHSGRRYRCGDTMRVRPHKTDVARGQLLLCPA